MPCFTTTYSVAIVARRFTVLWLGSALLYKEAPLTTDNIIKDPEHIVRKLCQIVSYPTEDLPHNHPEPELGSVTSLLPTIIAVTRAIEGALWACRKEHDCDDRI